jgi:hypothetical protein
MGKSSHKSKHRARESEEAEEFVVPQWVSLIVSRQLKVYAKEMLNKFLRMKINAIDADIQKQLEHVMSLSDKDREEHFAAMLEESKPARAKKPKAVKKPNEPKKPQSAYFIWSAKFKKDDLDREYPEYAEQIKNKELIASKARGMIWKELPSDEKEEFHRLADKEKERYNAEMKVFDPNFVPTASRAPSRAPSRANSPEPPAKPKKKAAPARDESPKRKPVNKKQSQKTEEVAAAAPAKKAKKQKEEEPPAPKKKAAAAATTKKKVSSSSSEESNGQSEGPSEWAD